MTTKTVPSLHSLQDRQIVKRLIDEYGVTRVLELIANRLDIIGEEEREPLYHTVACNIKRTDTRGL